MRSPVSMIALGVALVFACAAPSYVHAEEGAATAKTPRLMLSEKVIDNAVLDTQRGGADTHLSDIRAVGSVSEVQAYDLVTGHNIVSDGALSGSTGMPMFIQNSGNGVLIQNAVILNVQVQ